MGLSETLEKLHVIFFSLKITLTAGRLKKVIKYAASPSSDLLQGDWEEWKMSFTIFHGEECLNVVR